MAAETFAFISGKGGVGKTTLAANVGAVMSHVLDYETTIVDTDVSSSHLGIHMGFHSNPATINSVLKGDHSLEEGVYKHDSGVNVVPGALTYDDAKDVDVYKLPEVVEELEEEADVVLLDCSPGLDRETSAAIRAADTVVYVSRPSFTSVMDVIRAQSLVEELETDSVGLVLNMVRGKQYEIAPDEIESFTDLAVIGRVPFDDTLEKAAAQGTPVTMYDPHTTSSRALEELAIHLLDEDPERKRGGFYRRMREILPGL